MGKAKTPMLPDGRQLCRDCKVIKPRADFEPTHKRTVGITAGCRECLAADREVAALVNEMNAEGIRRQSATTVVPDYAPRSEVIPEAYRKSADEFRRIDAARRRMRLQRRK